MKSMKLSVKLTGSSLIVACLIMVMGYIGISRVGLLDKAGAEIQEKNIKPLGYIANMAVAFQREGGYIRDILLDQFIYVKDVSTDVAKIKELDQKLKENSEKFSKALTSVEDRKIVESLKTELDQYISVRDKLIESIKGGLLAEARNLLQGDVYTRAERIALLLDNLSDLQIKSVKKKMEQNSQTSAAASWLTWIIGGLGTLLAVVLGIFLTFSVDRPIRRVVEGIKEGAAQVSGAAAQVSSASQSLAEGSSRQAAGLEETSSSLEEMSAMTKQNADNAQQARVMMGEAGQIVGNVSHHMGQMAEAIGEITKSSEETGKIIKTIDEIAFQTNLLALNAAVEAARAGEAGAGFAVVADEVRNLAMRAAEAAKNTSNLIENTIKSVKSGNELTLATQEAFKKNVDISNKIGRLIDEIAAASQEQAQGISQLNQAVTEIDKVTQQNAANAEESASAAEEMTSQALQFKEFVKDLAAVLEGNRNGNGGGSSKNLRLSSGGTTPRSIPKSFPEKGERRILTPPDTRGKKTAHPPRPKQKEITPEEVIPMDEDFKEF